MISPIVKNKINIGDEMEEIYLEEVSIKRMEEVKEFVEEFFYHQSRIYGDSNLFLCFREFPTWLDEIKKSSYHTYFLIRAGDNRLIGILRTCYQRNFKMNQFSAPIEYSIRPTERGKGYGKKCLFLGLNQCYQNGMKVVFLSIDDGNFLIEKTIESLGGVLVGERYHEEFGYCMKKTYAFDLEACIKGNFGSGTSGKTLLRS